MKAILNIIIDWIKEFDYFGVTISPMNFGGTDVINTFYGGFCSIIAKVLLIMFFLNKLNEMVNFSQPNIT